MYPDDFKSEHGAEFEYDEILTLSNCKSTNINGLDMIGGVFITNYIDQGYEDPETGEWVSASSSVTEEDMTFDKSALLSNISGYDLITNPISLQVGINGDSSSSITFDTNFLYNLSNITNGKKVYDNAYDIINNFMDTLSAKATSLGAVSNRLDSAYESTSVAMENLTSSLSTIRDADIAKESSAYIKAQILQQASATLLATANQSPSIALQLL